MGNETTTAVKPQPKPQQQIQQPKPHPQLKPKPNPGYAGKPTVRVNLTPLALSRCSATEFLAWVRQQIGEV